REGPVDLRPAVIRDEDPGDTAVDGNSRVLRVENALEQDGQIRRATQERKVIPVQRWTRVDLEEEPHGGGRHPGAQVAPERAWIAARELEQGADGGRRDRATGRCRFPQPLLDQA